MTPSPALRKVSPPHQVASEDTDERMAAIMRVALALSAMLAFWWDPDVYFLDDRFGYAILSCFIGYSAVTCALVFSRARRLPLRVAPWIDVVWGALLISFNGGTSSIFFPFYFFAILLAAFSSGLRAGVALTFASVASFIVVGYLTAPAGSGFEPGRTLLRPLFLLGLGYMIAYWGGFERRTRARLRLLRDVMASANPRLGVDATLANLLHLLRAFYDACSCRLVFRDGAGGPYRMHSASRDAPGAAAPVPVSPELAQDLLPVAETAAVLFKAGYLGLRTPVVVNLDVASGERSRRVASGEARLANLLEAGSFVSVPLRYQPEATGRLYIASPRRDTFDPSDLDFMLQVLAQLGPVLENIRLVDRLASEAADEERRRIARDIHDSVIQPYIGLSLGIAGALQALESGRVTDAQRHMARLIELSDDEVEELRSYVGGLRGSDGAPRADRSALAAAVGRFCERFSTATGIEVRFDLDGEVAVTERLAAEVFQMVAEALSNVRRHTEAARAAVRLELRSDALSLHVSNDLPREGEAPAFSPRSLTDRAAALGGRVGVHTRPGETVVNIEVPL